MNNAVSGSPSGGKHSVCGGEARGERAGPRRLGADPVGRVHQFTSTWFGAQAITATSSVPSDAVMPAAQRTAHAAFPDRSTPTKPLHGQSFQPSHRLSPSRATCARVEGRLRRAGVRARGCRRLHVGHAPTDSGRAGRTVRAMQATVRTQLVDGTSAVPPAHCPPSRSWSGRAATAGRVGDGDRRHDRWRDLQRVGRDGQSGRSLCLRLFRSRRGYRACHCAFVRDALAARRPIRRAVRVSAQTRASRKSARSLRGC